ncbi:hypothetical protein B9479_007749, partial [Cryptococcus floricola]
MSQEGHDPRTYNTPTSNDVALIYDNSNDPDHNGRELAPTLLPLIPSSLPSIH